MKRYVGNYVVDFDIEAVLMEKNNGILFRFTEDWENRNFQIPLIKKTATAEAMLRIIAGQLEALKKLDESIDAVFSDGMPYRPESPDELSFYVRAIEGGFNNENAVKLKALCTDYKGRLWKEAIHNADFYNC